MAPFSLPLVVIWGGSGLGRGRVLWLVEDNPLGQGWGWETDFFGLPYSPYVRQARALGLPFAAPCPGAGSRLPASPPLLPILPERPSGWGWPPSVCCAGVWRERWGGAWGWVAESVVSGKAGMFSSTARLPCLPPLSLSPTCCMGTLQAPSGSLGAP